MPLIVETRISGGDVLNTKGQGISNNPEKPFIVMRRRMDSGATIYKQF
jgi:hypothetical protein